MKTNIATDNLQSARLLRCGVSADTADMYISNYGDLWASPFKDNQRKDEKGFTPAWSLSALLGLLPKRIKRGDCSDYTLSLSCDGCFWDLEYTYARYCGEDDSLVLFEDTDPIEVCVQAIEWLTENNYKLNEQ